MTIGRIGFAYNPTNDAAVDLRERAAGWARAHGLDHWAVPSGDFDGLVRELPRTDVLVVLGGDGTFLRAASALRGYRARNKSGRSACPPTGCCAWSNRMTPAHTSWRLQGA